MVERSAIEDHCISMRTVRTILHLTADPPAIPVSPPAYESVVNGPNDQRRPDSACDTSSSLPQNHSSSTEQSDYDATQARQSTDKELCDNDTSERT